MTERERAPKTQIFAENRRFPRRFTPEILEIPAFGGRRFSQETADFRRKPQETADWDLRCVTFSSALFKG